MTTENEEPRPEESSEDRPRAILTNPEALTNPSAEDDANALRPPPLERDEDLLDDYPADSEDVDLVHCRITSIPSLGLSKLTAVQKLCLRQNEIQKIEGFECIASTLLDLDLYDNGIGHMSQLDSLVNLESLDLSYNAIKHIKNLEALVKLKNLYMSSNRVSRIEGLSTLTNLTNLELGANRIREIENLEALTKLEQLWLGKNKITEIKNISLLSNLRILSLPSNRLTKLSGLDGLTGLEELYVSHNAIEDLSGLENTPNIQILDVTHNKLKSIKGIEHLSKLMEFWASENEISSFREVEEVLRDKEDLETVYFEANPLQTSSPATYRNKVKLALPQIKQIDASKLAKPKHVKRAWRQAHADENGKLLASTISLTNTDLEEFAYSTNSSRVAEDVFHALEYENNSSRPKITNKSGLETWAEVYVAFWKVAQALERYDEVDWGSVFAGMKELTQAVIRGFQNGTWEVWQLEVLYTACKYLRYVAIRADEVKRAEGEDTWKSLEEAARIINRAFNTCLNDRAELAQSRKWGTYCIINILFKIYFKLNAITLSKNILKALVANNSEMPDLLDFRTSDVVTFKYYCGVIAFLDEDYFKAEEHLEMAHRLCHKDAQKNKQLILTYLIPTKLLTRRQLPTAELLAPYPTLETLILPLARCIKSGNLREYDENLAKGEDWFVKKRIFLTLERGRDIALRNLFRQVYLSAGDSKTRIPVDHFRAAVSWKSGVDVEAEEVECFLANMIYKGYIKGYISRERGMVVLSGSNAFPGTGV
ncbi:Internalin-A [Dactylella cylindrospora]|nr:Internalin-A [Dactylella cylindrospora]